MAEPNKQPLDVSYSITTEFDRSTGEYVTTSPAWSGYEGRGDTSQDSVQDWLQQINAVVRDAADAGVEDLLPDSDLEWCTAPEMLERFRGVLDQAERAGAIGDIATFLKAMSMMAQQSSLYSAQCKLNVQRIGRPACAVALVRQFREHQAARLTESFRRIRDVLRPPSPPSPPTT